MPLQCRFTGPINTTPTPRRLLFAVIGLISLSLSLLNGSFLSQGKGAAQEPPTKDTKVDFVRDIRPILADRCFLCHGSETHLSGLRLDRKENALKGGESGKPAVVPGNSAESHLIQLVSGVNPKVVMPPTGERLSAGQIQLLRAWIDQGATWSETTETEGHATTADHWAFKPIQEAELPSVKRREWIRNPIDAFVLAKLESRGWTPSPAAEPRAILRRVYLDLIGLPPRLDEQEAFSRNPSVDALDQIIDNLLLDPGYGERWGRHWLDLVRYAETNGYERDAVKPFVWRYRDYVIRAFNNDKPYNRFILEQIAGDELPDASAETLIAMGFNRLGHWDDEPADRQQDRFDQLDDIVSTTSEVFLGLTLGCARCHNHKYDPLTAEDYYRMVAIFNGLERAQDGRIELDLPVGTREEIALEAQRDKPIHVLKTKIEELKAPFGIEHLKAGRSKLPAEAVEALLVEPAKRTEVQMVYAQGFAKQFDAEVLSILPDDVRQTIAVLEQEIQKIRAAQPDLPRGYFMHETAPNPPASHILIRGQAARPGEPVASGVPAVLTGEQPVFPTGKRTSLRRLTLAQWLARPDNALTARVIVNRVWQFHFGEGLVRTPSDFGRMGERPTHPELLDWLAGWFVSDGWSLKKLHRLIMTSNTYRMSKRWNAEYGSQDPENRLLWRFPNRRLEVEAIRDSILAVSGQLNRRMFGPSMYPLMPEAVLKTHKDVGKEWEAFNEEEASRRTLYAHIKRSMIIPMLEVLDFCNTTRSSAQRLVTSIAPQALTMFNGEDVNREARHFARRLINEVGPDREKQVERAYLLALCRPPTPQEKTALLEFLKAEAENLVRESTGSMQLLPDDKQSSKPQLSVGRAPAGNVAASTVAGSKHSHGAAPIDPENARLKALEQMCRAIFNLNEFVYAD